MSNKEYYYLDVDDLALSTEISRKQSNNPIPLKEVLRHLKRLGLLPLDENEYNPLDSVVVYDTLHYPPGINKPHDSIK